MNVPWKQSKGFEWILESDTYKFRCVFCDFECTGNYTECINKINDHLLNHHHIKKVK